METFPIEPYEELSEDNETELTPEVKAVIEQFREKRAGILSKIMSERAAKITETAVLMAPGTDIIALASAAARGETLTGKELDNKSRLNHAAMAGFLTLSYTLLAVGMNREALEAKGMAATFGAMEFGPDLVQKTIAAAKQHIPAMVNFIQNTGEYLTTSDSDLTSLELNG
jgi:hypothetical protein